MTTDVRQRMIAGAAALLAKNGLQATSFAEVLKRTGAPRGSIYYHFPEGKSQLIAAALELSGNHAIDALNAKVGEPPLSIASHFLDMWRSVLAQSNLTGGCAVLAVAIAADSPELLDQTAAIFRTWRARLAYLLEEGGMQPADAAHFAVMLIATSEGAVVLARAEQSMDPFNLATAYLLAQISAATAQ